MESLAYVWVYLLKGKLPWQGVKGETNEERHEKLKNIKMSVSVEQLCEGLPREFQKYLNTVRSLKFED